MSGTIQTSFEAGHLIFMKSFPDELFAIPQINEVTKLFAHFRADIEVTIVFTCAPTTQGIIRVITMPDVNENVLNNRTDTLLQQSQWDNHLIVFPALPHKTFILPWVSQW